MMTIAKTQCRTANIGLAIWRLKRFYETFVQGSTAVILMNFSAKIRHIAKPKTVSSKPKSDFFSQGLLTLDNNSVYTAQP
jgi:hypothetical protein